MKTLDQASTASVGPEKLTNQASPTMGRPTSARKPSAVAIVAASSAFARLVVELHAGNVVRVGHAGSPAAKLSTARLIRALAEPPADPDAARYGSPFRGGCHDRLAPKERAVFVGPSKDYGAEAVSFFDFFASPPAGFEERMLALIATGDRVSGRRAARLLQAYEVLYWDTLADGLH